MASTSAGLYNESTPKRGPGRPKGSTNKAKKESPKKEKVKDVPTPKWLENEIKAREEKVKNSNSPILVFYKLDASVPNVIYGTSGAACFDLRFQMAGKRSYAVYDQTNTKKEREFNGKAIICPGETAMLPTGLIASIPQGYSLRIFNRSSVPLKRHLFLANSVGVVDEDFTDEIMLLMYNAGASNQEIEEGERLAQGELVPVIRPVVLYTPDRPGKVGDRIGGYGSTGK